MNPKGSPQNLTHAGKGRKKGVPNKSTASVKEALTLAFQGLGGVPKLQAWAQENPTPFYQLWGKMLPADIAHSGELTVNGVVILPATKKTGDR